MKVVPCLAVTLARLALVISLLGQAIVCRAGLVDVVASARRSIAAVGTYNAVDNPRFTFRGTGFVVGDGNQLVTNAHVLPPPAASSERTELVVLFANAAGSQEMRRVSVMATDRSHDLVLLRFGGSPLPPLALAADGDVQEGLSIALIGFPIGGVLGYRPVTHRGIISSITAIALPTPSSKQLNEATIHRLREGSFDIYQLDATAYPGNSGGPVLDAQTGRVVGVVNLVLAKSTKESLLSQPTGISYAIPARFVDDLLKR